MLQVANNIQSNLVFIMLKLLFVPWFNAPTILYSIYILKKISEG